MNLRNRLIASVGAAVLFASSLAGVAHAETSQSSAEVVITGGELTASITAYDLADLNFGFENQSVSGNLDAELSDMTGSYDGWEATLALGTLNGVNGDGSDLSIPVAATGVSGPTTIAGQTWNGTCFAAGASGGGCSVGEGQGSGHYSVSIPLSATIPGNTPTQTLTSVATLTYSTGP